MLSSGNGWGEITINQGFFDSSISMQQYISQGAGKEEWMIKQLQGKGYEWDWITAQRESAKRFSYI